MSEGNILNPICTSDTPYTYVSLSLFWTGMSYLFPFPIHPECFHAVLEGSVRLYAERSALSLQSRIHQGNVTHYIIGSRRPITFSPDFSVEACDVILMLSILASSKQNNIRGRNSGIQKLAYKN